jgi:hypothetical protein
MFVARGAVVNRFREKNSDDKAIEEAERAGFDLSLVDSNLRLADDDRAARHEGALAFAWEPPHQNKFWPRREETAFFFHQRLAEAVS